MKHFCRFFFLLCVSFFVCGCSSSKSPPVRLGIDPYWYPVDFGNQSSQVNGFVEELLLEISAYNGVEFERIEANWDNLFSGMERRKYDAVLSSLPPYNFNLAQYDFSQVFLPIGPVLVVSTRSPHVGLDQMKGEVVGSLEGDSYLNSLQKYPELIMRTYLTIPDLFNALIEGEIEGVVIDSIRAAPYVRDLYAGQLMIVGKPLTNAGLHLITLKDRNKNLIKMFNKTLDSFKKNRKLSKLMEKWQLSYSDS